MEAPDAWSGGADPWTHATEAFVGAEGESLAAAAQPGARLSGVVDGHLQEGLHGRVTAHLSINELTTDNDQWNEAAARGSPLDETDAQVWERLFSKDVRELAEETMARV